MRLFVKTRSFLRNLFLSESVEADLDQEVHSHLEMLIEENIRAGMQPKDAQRAARIELGGIEQVKEQFGTNALAIGSLRDLRLPLRSSTTPQESRLHSRRHPHPSSRHRCDHGDFQRGIRRVVAAATVSQSEPDHGHLRGHLEGQAVAHRGPELRRFSRPKPQLPGDCQVQ